MIAQRRTLVGATPEEFIEPYTTAGWEADLSAWQAMAMATTAQEDLVRQTVAALLRPWLDDTASRFQKAVASSGLPTPADQSVISAEPGEVLLFADGLRADLRRESAGGPSVATTPKPIDDGAVRSLVEDDELEGTAVVAVLLSTDCRVIAQRRTLVGGDDA